MLSPQVIEDLIARSQPRRRLPGLRLPLYVLGGIVIGVALAQPGSFGLPAAAGDLAPLVLVVIVLVLGRAELGRHLHQKRDWSRAYEAVLLEEWSAASRRLEALLSRPVSNRVLRAQGLLGLAAVTDHYGRYDSSRLIYQALLAEETVQPVQRHAAAVGLAAAMLRNDELTDAVSLIDRLARSADDAPLPWKAQIELLRLFREVVMGQYDDILEHTEQRRHLFRDGLSTRSGYGYALMALGHHRRGRSDSATRLWHDATVLVPVSKLVRRFPALEELTRRYPARETPL